MARLVKKLSANAGDIKRLVWFLSQEDPREEGLATHSSILAWRIPWTEEPGRLQSIGSQRVQYHWSDLAQHIMVILFLGFFFFLYLTQESLLSCSISAVTYYQTLMTSYILAAVPLPSGSSSLIQVLATSGPLCVTLNFQALGEDLAALLSQTHPRSPAYTTNSQRMDVHTWCTEAAALPFGQPQ